MMALVRLCPHRFRRDVLAIRVNVGEDRTSAAHDDGAGGRDEAAGRDHHLVAGSDAEDIQSEIERDRAVRQSDPETGPAGACELLLERAALRAGPIVDLTGAQDRGRGRDLLLVEMWPVQPTSGR